jgi:hypothetical protein
MQLYRSALKVLVATCVLAAAFSFAAAPANATGTFLIQHGNGKVNVYKNVRINVIHGALYVTSADGKGTVVLNRAACSYQGKILVCLPTSVTLVQGGYAKAIDLKIGTVYLNDTDDPQPLALSSRKIPPDSLMVSFTTKSGSYVSLSGRIDGVVK